MTDDTLEVTTPRGTMPVYLQRPDGDGPAPLVVLYMDAPGVRPALHGWAQRLAEAGYATALPDLYYEVELADRPDLSRLQAGEQDEFARMSTLIRGIDERTVLEDTGLMLAALGGSEERPWGCIGFCMGGRFGMRAAESWGDTLAAASLLHPSRLVTDEPDSPHLAVGEIGGELYFGFGENDHVTPPSMIPPLRDELERHDVTHHIEVIPAADHGFTMPGMPAYNQAAAEQAWAGTLALLRSAL